jgi:hypothetical protein
MKRICIFIRSVSRFNPSELAQAVRLTFPRAKRAPSKNNMTPIGEIRISCALM